jgi:hypothetical protein
MMVSLLTCVFVANPPHTTAPLPRVSRAASSPLRASVAALVVCAFVPGEGCSWVWA